MWRGPIRWWRRSRAAKGPGGVQWPRRLYQPWAYIPRNRTAWPRRSDLELRHGASARRGAACVRSRTGCGGQLRDLTAQQETGPQNPGRPATRRKISSPRKCARSSDWKSRSRIYAANSSCRKTAPRADRLGVSPACPGKLPRGAGTGAIHERPGGFLKIG